MNEAAATPVAGGPAVVAAPLAAPAAALDPATSTAGQRLKAARERRGLSLQKAADKMHLDLWVIEALEGDQFDKIGPSVYVKGHLKHYAVMLGLPAAEIMAVYDAPPAAVATQRGALRLRTQEPVGIELPWGTIAAAAVVAVVISGLVWLRPWRSRNAPIAAATVAEQPLPRPAPAAAESIGDDAQDDDSTAAINGVGTAEPASVPTAPVARNVNASPKSARTASVAAANAGAAPAATATATAVGAGTVPTAAAGTGKAQLRLSFSADSWVEVHDAGGKPVFVGNGRANSVKTVAGDAPLRVYLRSASGVQLTINSHAVAIGPQFVAGDVARFEAGADGVLRRDTQAASSSAAAHEPRPHG